MTGPTTGSRAPARSGPGSADHPKQHDPAHDGAIGCLVQPPQRGPGTSSSAGALQTGAEGSMIASSWNSRSWPGSVPSEIDPTTMKVSGKLATALTGPQRTGRMKRLERKRVGSAWRLLLLRTVLLLLSVLLPPSANASSADVPTTIHVEMVPAVRGGHDHAAATQVCQMALACIAQDVLPSSEAIMLGFLDRQRFAVPDRLDRPSRQLPVDLPPPRPFT
jgi:hypothetical protein